MHQVYQNALTFLTLPCSLRLQRGINALGVSTLGYGGPQILNLYTSLGYKTKATGGKVVQNTRNRQQVLYLCKHEDRERVGM